MFAPDTYTARRNALHKKLKSGLVLMLGNGESPINYAGNTYPYQQDSTFRYFFGIGRPGFVGVMDIDNDTDCLYADEWTLDDLIWMGPQPSAVDEAAKVGIQALHASIELESTINSAIKKGRKIHFLPPYRAETRIRIGQLLGILPSRVGDHVSRDLIRAVVSLREIKQPEEIVQLDEVSLTGYKMHTAAMRMAFEGTHELDIAAELVRIAAAGKGNTSFQSIVSQHGETLHNHNYVDRLETGRLLLVDAGAQNALGYTSDHTRTLPVGGKFSERQKEIYNLVLAANERAQELAKPGVTYQSIHVEAMKVLARGLTQLGLMKGDPDEAVALGAVALFMPHGLGHQMGLDVHDMEDLGEKYVGYDDATTRSTQFGLSALRMGKHLRPGHVVTVEPGIYFIPKLIEKWEKEQILRPFIDYAKLRNYLTFGGIRIEDDILITPKGNRLIGRHRPPVTVAEVESFMAKVHEQ